MSAPIRWGFLGAGFVATNGMAPAVHAADGAVLQVVGSADAIRAERLGGVRAVTGYEAVLNAADVDAVYISLSNEQHLPWTIAALEAGKHVLCEKPLAISLTDTQLMLKAADDARLVLIEGLWGRWHPRFAQIRDGVASGEWGALRHVNAGFTFGGVPADNYRLDPHRGGGAWWDVGVYPLDLLLSLAPIGELGIENVRRRVGDSGVDLDTEVTLTLGEMRAEVTTSIDGPEKQWLTITTDRGELSVTRGQPFTSWRAATDLVFTATGEPPITWRFEAVDPYVAMIEDASSQIAGRGSSSVMPSPGELMRLAQHMDAVSCFG